MEEIWLLKRFPIQYNTHYQFTEKNHILLDYIQVDFIRRYWRTPRGVSLPVSAHARTLNSPQPHPVA